jgi:hypothetical protein
MGVNLKQKVLQVLGSQDYNLPILVYHIRVVKMAGITTIDQTDRPEIHPSVVYYSYPLQKGPRTSGRR